ncbi:MAG: DUF5655 domain-containing protein [Anaerolineales bacterium]
MQSYLDEVKARTGKTVDDFRVLAARKNIRKAREFVSWLNTEFGLGYHHAGAVWYMLSHADDFEASTTQKIAAHFTGNKAKWRKPYDALAKKVAKFGKDAELSPNMTYINVLRHNKKFAIVQPSATRLDIGLKLKGVKPTKRFEAAGSWNAMVTHRVRITDGKQIDKEVLAWLKQAYEAA